MALPLRNGTQINDIADKFTNREGVVYIGPARPPSKGKDPTHKVGVGGYAPQQGSNSANFAVDDDTAVAEVATLLFNAVPAVGKKYRFGNITYTTIANGGTPAATTSTTGEIAVGATAAATNTAFKTKLHADTAKIFADATNSADGIVTITASTAGVPFDFFSDDDTSVYAFTITTENVSNKGYLDIVFEAAGGLTPTANTETVLEIPLLFGVDEDVTINVEAYYQTQVSDSITLLASGMIGVLTAMLNQTDVGAVHGYVEGLGTTYSVAELKTAMRNFFGSSASAAFRLFSTKTFGDTIRLTLGTAGDDGANVWVGSECLPSPCGEVPINDAGQPDAAGWEDLCETKGFNVNLKNNLIDYVVSRSSSKRKTPGSTDADCTVEIYSQMDPKIQSLISGSKRSVTSSSRQVHLGSANGGDVAKGRGIMFVFADDDGSFGVIHLYSGTFTVLQLNAQIDSLNTVQLQIALNSFSGRSDKIGQFRRVRVAA